jgi:pimeloyl-ACP methyl ester carboxylesterase
MAGTGAHLPPRWPIAVALRGAAIAFAIAGFTRALTIAIAAHTEPAVVRNGGLASLGPTSQGALALGLALVGIAVVLGRRWIRRLALLPPAATVAATEPLPGGLRLVGPAGLSALDRHLSGKDSRLLRALVTGAWLATAVALAVGLSSVASALVGGEIGGSIALRLEVVAFGLAAFSALSAGWVVDRLGESATDRMSPFATPVPTRRRGARAVPVALLAAIVLYPTASIMVAGARERVPCPGLPGGDCRKVTVALDHRHPENGRTMEVVYRVAAARSDRLGTLVIAVGGPGVRGLAAADPLLGWVDPTIRDRYDLVFFDQRGVGGSGGPDCANATRVLLGGWSGDRIARDREFAQACLAELGAAAGLLPYDSTWQAAADVDAIRVSLGLDRIALYGESYGTLLGQAYAARYPDHVSALVLDGAIDPATHGLPFWRESARGFRTTLDATLAACSADPGCRAEVAGGDASLALDEQLATVAASPVPVDYPTGSAIFQLVIEPTDLVGAMGLALYDEQTRMELQRAVAAASHDDWLPWARLVVATRPEPITNRVEWGALPNGPWPAAHLATWTPAAYLAVACADVDAPAMAGGLEAFRMVAEDPDLDADPFAGIVYQDAACLDWPRPVDGQDPHPVSALSVPTLVLAATTDPITPPANAERIAGRTPGAGLVVSVGGPHVTYLRGDACVDGAVRRFLVEGQTAQPRTDCPGRVASDYVPRRWAAAGVVDTEAGIRAMADEIGALPEVTIWDGLGTFRIGCDAGGDILVRGSPDQIDLVVSGCAFVPELVLDGTGSLDPKTRSVTLAVSRVP